MYIVPATTYCCSDLSICFMIVVLWGRRFKLYAVQMLGVLLAGNYISSRGGPRRYVRSLHYCVSVAT